MHQLNDSTVGFGRTDYNWDAYTHGQRAARQADHNPAAYPNPYQYHGLSWYSFNAGWNSIYPDDDGKEAQA